MATIYDLEMDDLGALEEALRIRKNPPAQQGDINELMRIFNG